MQLTLKSYRFILIMIICHHVWLLLQEGLPLLLCYSRGEEALHCFPLERMGSIVHYVH